MELFFSSSNCFEEQHEGRSLGSRCQNFLVRGRCSRDAASLAAPELPSGGGLGPPRVLLGVKGGHQDALGRRTCLCGRVVPARALLRPAALAWPSLMAACFLIGGFVSGTFAARTPSQADRYLLSAVPPAGEAWEEDWPSRERLRGGGGAACGWAAPAGLVTAAISVITVAVGGGVAAAKGLRGGGWGIVPSGGDVAGNGNEWRGGGGGRIVASAALSGLATRSGE